MSPDFLQPFNLLWLTCHVSKLKSEPDAQELFTTPSDLGGGEGGGGGGGVCVVIHGIHLRSVVAAYCKN